MEGFVVGRAVCGVSEGIFCCVVVGFSVGSEEGPSEIGSEAGGGRYLSSQRGGASAGAGKESVERPGVVEGQGYFVRRYL